MSKAIVNAIAGVDVDRVDTTAALPLGATVRGVDGIEYRYVKAAEAISTTTNEPYALGIDEGNLASRLTAALGLAGYQFGIAPRLAIAVDTYFWARTDGPNVPIRVAASAAADARLGIGGVGATGRLASSVTASAGNMIVMGLVITAVGSASASAGNTIRNALMNNPMCTTAVAD